MSVGDSSSSSSSLRPSSGQAVPEQQPPQMGKSRAKWLRMRLVRLLHEDVDVCPGTAGSTAEEMLALFERVTGEHFSDTPGTALTSRIRSIAKVLGNITREVEFTPPLSSTTRGMYRVWNRAPRMRVDIDCWRRQEQQRGALAGVAMRSRSTMAAVDAEITTWLRGHRYLRPTEVENGETGMALLILWEVDHGRPFPAGVEAGNVAATLASFSRRLRLRVQQDDQLREWLEVREMQFPLAPGLPPSHQLRWSVRVERPQQGESHGWYDEFVIRWRAYLETLATASSCGQRSLMAAVTRPEKRRRVTSPASSQEPSICLDGGSAAVPAELSAGPRKRKQSGSVGTTISPSRKRRQGDLRAWLRPAQLAAGHGRAVDGPPT